MIVLNINSEHKAMLGHCNTIIEYARVILLNWNPVSIRPRIFTNPLPAKLRMENEYSPLVKVNKKGLSTDTYHTAEARCPVGTRVTGGGGQISPARAPSSGLFDWNAYDVADNNVVSLNIIPVNRLDAVAKMETSGNIMAYATCLSGDAEVSLNQQFCFFTCLYSTFNI